MPSMEKKCECTMPNFYSSEGGQARRAIRLDEAKLIGGLMMIRESEVES
jgi:hypothetical protein